MKVLGILGSPHSDGPSAFLLKVALKAANSIGAEIELISVYDGKIEPCKGCVQDEEPNCKFPCIYDDFGKVILEKIYTADGIIFATPIYWFAPSGPMKLLIDRMTCLENMVAYGEPSYMEGKVVGVIAIGADAGGPWVGGYLITTFTCMGAIIPPWGIAYCHKAEQCIKDKKILMDAMNVGLLVTKTAMTVKGCIENIRFLEDEELMESIKKEVEEEFNKK